jgi:Domain of Unknown Function (DUF928)
MISHAKVTKSADRSTRPSLLSLDLWQGIILATLLIGCVGANRALASGGIEPPPDKGVPKGTAGGGSRPVQRACLNRADATSQLVALSPMQKLGLTMVDHPQFLIYLPPTKAQKLELSLFDRQQNGIYQTTLPIPKTSGVVSIPLPASAPRLAKTHPYAWSIALICDPRDRTEDWVVTGWIQRADLQPQLRHNLAQASAIERVKLFSEQGFWYEAAAALLELRQQTPNDPQVVAMWQELLKSAGLETIVN